MGDSDKDKTLRAKTFAFSIQCVRLAEMLQGDGHAEINSAIKKREFVMSRQLLRSGTSVGAMIREAEQAHSKPDFIAKLTIGLKEASESLA